MEKINEMKSQFFRKLLKCDKLNLDWSREKEKHKLLKPEMKEGISLQILHKLKGL